MLASYSWHSSPIYTENLISVKLKWPKIILLHFFDSPMFKGPKHSSIAEPGLSRHVDPFCGNIDNSTSHEAGACLSNLGRRICTSFNTIVSVSARTFFGHEIMPSVPKYETHHVSSLKLLQVTFISRLAIACMDYLIFPTTFNRLPRIFWYRWSNTCLTPHHDFANAWKK